MIVIQTYVAYPFLIPCIIVGVISLIISAVLLTSCYYSTNDFYIKIKSNFINIFLGLTLSCILAGAYAEERKQIIINDETSILELREKYEIIDQKGISYIVKEIELKD